MFYIDKSTLRNAFYKHAEKVTLLQWILIFLALWFLVYNLFELAWPYIVDFYLYLRIEKGIKLRSFIFYCLEIISFSVLVYNLFGFLKTYCNFRKRDNANYD